MSQGVSELYVGHHDDLEQALCSEVYGQAAFSAAAGTARGERRSAWRTLERLETQTRARLEEHVTARGQVPRPHRLQAARGVAGGTVMPLLPWSAQMRLLVRATDHYLPIFGRLAEANADGPDGDLFDYALRHELALAAFAAAELRGDAGSLAPVCRLLEAHR